MQHYLFVLGREPQLSLAEIESVFSKYSTTPQLITPNLAKISLPDDIAPDINRFGGSVKIARIITQKPLEYLLQLPAGKITLGLSDYSPHASAKTTWQAALKLKNLLRRQGRSVRLIPNQSPSLSSATAHHNQLGEKLNHVELIRFQNEYAVSIGTQNITAYSKRDQARPARDAFVGMLPPKLAQILINLATDGTTSGLLLDPFCGTGVILQEAVLAGLDAYGSDLSQKMIDYSQRNLNWLSDHHDKLPSIKLEVGDAQTAKWQPHPDFVASEIYLGHPLSQPPSDIKLKTLQNESRALLLAFLRNLAPQLTKGAQVALATPAWLRPDGSYSGLNLLDEIKNLGYNPKKYRVVSQSDLLYHRENQVVARQIIVLRKK